MVNQTAAASPRFSTTLSPVSNPLISVRGLTKIYGQADTERAVTALDNVDVDFPRAQFTAIMGPSGSGKSSLLHILAGLDSFQSGTVKVAGRDLSQLNAAELTRFRRDKIGFIFQSFNLVPTLNVAENIELSAMVRRHSPDRRRLKALVKELDMESRLGAFPSELSGGQQQKVACARALLTAPEVVFADEPTGNLDSASSAQVLSFLRAAARDWEQSVIMVTHEPDAAKYADRVLFLFDGQIVGQLENPTRETILEAEQNLGDVRQARKRAGQLGTPQSLQDVDPEALEKDLTAVMSLPKIEEETDSEQVESPAEEAAVLPKSAPDTQPSSISPYLQSAFPVGHTAPESSPTPAPAPPPPSRRQRDTALTFANLGIAEANPEPNELADSLARGDFKWPSMSVARPDSPDDTNDLLGKPLASGFASSDTGWNSAAAGEHNATFDSVIAGSAESAGDSYETAPDSDPTDYGDTGFNPFDFTNKPAPTVSGAGDSGTHPLSRRPILGGIAAKKPAPTAPTPVLPPDAAAPVVPPTTDAWADNPPTLVPSSASSRILSEAFTPETVPAQSAEPDSPHPQFPESVAAQSDTISSIEVPAAEPEPQPEFFAEPEPEPEPEPQPKPEPTRERPRRPRRPAVDPHLAEAEGKNELLAMIEQAEKLLAASGAAINDATETLQETAAPHDSRPSESALAARTPRDTAASSTPYGGNPNLPSRGKTPDQELLIARADAMLAQAEARSATLQDDLRNLGRTPGSATPDTPAVPVPGADPAETFPPNLRTPSLKYPTKGR